MNRSPQSLLMICSVCLLAFALLLVAPVLAQSTDSKPPAKGAAAKGAAAKPAAAPPPGPATPAPAANPSSSSPPRPAGRAQPAKITVAILDFEGKDPANPDLGKNVAQIITAILGSEDSITLVDRSHLDKTLQEHGINLTGLVNTDQAVKVGHLVGAKIIITGSCFMVGQQSFLTAKVIGVETTLFKPVLVKGQASDVKLDELAVQLATAVAETLHKHGQELIAADAGADPLPGLVQALSTRQRPRVAVIISENHVSWAHTPDPAAETEIKILLHKAGFEIQDVDENDLASWARNMDRNDISAWPKSLAHADVVVTGKAFSEFGARIGTLVSCTARLEINVISRRDGKILLPDRTTTRDVDLSENIAAKKALQKAGHALGVDILSYFIRTLPPAPVPPAGAPGAPAANPQPAPH